MRKEKKFKRGDVAEISGTMYGQANIINARAINHNAGVLMQALDRLEVLEDMMCSHESKEEEK